ncbi:hypothetical protein MAR_015988 [Mya arenaria]|uniref:Uncharacterized protein n=1 Tax=Mya arenaria TaxID=6604 RepID=A0ABY7FLH0_MYAAR|nr:hypothetical protein MAR_015988 [Mya arenaria]
MYLADSHQDIETSAVPDVLGVPGLSPTLAKEVYVPHVMFARACSKNPMKRGAAMALKLADIKPISLPSPDMEIFLQTADPRCIDSGDDSLYVTLVMLLMEHRI